MESREIAYKSIKSRFVSYAFQVLIASSVIIVGILGFMIYLIQINIVLPVNYYENMVPEIRKSIEENSQKLLQDDTGQILEALLPSHDIGYKVIARKGEVLYQNKIGTQITDLNWNKLNKYEEQDIERGIFQDYITRYFPIMKDDMYQGGVIIRYPFNNTSNLPLLRNLAPYFTIIMAVTPFIVMLIVIIIYSGKFIRALQKPLSVLEEGINRIQENDLEFTLSCKSQDEIGRLCASFEKMRKALKESLEENWKQEEERKNLMSGLSHDLRTPLTVIEGYAEILLDDEVPKREMIRTGALAIQKNAYRLKSLVEAINNVNKWQQIELARQEEAINLKVFLKERIQDYQVLAKEKKIDLNYCIETSDEVLRLNETALTQILDNIIGNSLRFTPHGGKISILVKEENQFISFSIEDTGCGFKDEDIKEGFNLFYEGNKSRTNGVHYGVGLYVVQHLTRIMGGDARLYNTAAHGAGIYICFLKIEDTILDITVEP